MPSLQLCLPPSGRRWGTSILKPRRPFWRPQGALFSWLLYPSLSFALKTNQLYLVTHTQHHSPYTVSSILVKYKRLPPGSIFPSAFPVSLYQRGNLKHWTACYNMPWPLDPSSLTRALITRDPARLYSLLFQISHSTHCVSCGSSDAESEAGTSVQSIHWENALRRTVSERSQREQGRKKQNK